MSRTSRLLGPLLDRDRPAPRPIPWLLSVLGLTGFAISQPLLSVLGENPTVFTFHNVTGGALVLFATGIAVLPPLVLWALGMGARAVDPRLGRAAFLLTVAGLSGATAIQAGKALGLEAPGALLAVGVGIAVALCFAVERFNAAATWLQFTAVLPLLALGSFLFTSPSSDLFRAPAAVAEADDADLAPVVFLLFDELPTLSILDAEGEIDRERFPNLASFAEQATWYRQHTVVAPTTQTSVPAMLTGRDPDLSPPLWTSHPDNLFSLLAPTHELVAFETATALCGFERCVEGPPGSGATGEARLGDLVTVTTDLLAERISLTGDQGARLDTFEEVLADPQDTELGGMTVSDPFASERVTTLPERLERFLEALEPADRPALYYLHLMLPHTPWRFYETGEIYDAPHIMSPAYPFANENDEGPWISALMEMRHLLQAEYTDLLLGELLDRLQETGLYDEALVVVASDHGISFLPDTGRRQISEADQEDLEGLAGLAYAPLLIKTPDQAEGRVDDTNLSSIDVLPTIAAELRLEVPWETDGVPAGSPVLEGRGSEKRLYDLDVSFSGTSLRRVIHFDAATVAPDASQRWIVPATEDRLLALYERFDLDHLIGRDLGEWEPGSAVSATIVDDPLGHGDPPMALTSGTVDAAEDGAVVVALEGVVVAASPLEGAPPGSPQFSLFLPADASAGPGRELHYALVTDAGEVRELDLG